MTSSKANFTPLPELPMTIAITLSTLIMAYSTKVGFASIILFYAMWMPLMLIRRSLIFKPFGPVFFVLLLPLLCTYSVFWSQEPGRSLYFGLQFFSMVLCTVIIARVTPILILIKGLALGCFAVILLSITSGNYQQDYFSGEYSLFGYFSSKNMVGLYADACILTSLLLLFSPIRRIEKVFFAIIPIATGLAGLYLSRSASSLVALMFVMAVVIGTYILTRLPRGLRPVLLVLGALSVLTALLFVQAYGLDLQSSALHGLGKDTTLTGRTYLWAEGIKAGLKHLWLGYGYSGFWVAGNPLAERYWAEFDIAGRTGFHFHSAFVQTFVDLGLLGLFLALLLIVRNFVQSFYNVLRHGMSLEYTFALGVSVMFIIRAFVEVDFLGQYGIGTLLVYSVIPLLTKMKPDTLQPPTTHKEQ